MSETTGTDTTATAGTDPAAQDPNATAETRNDPAAGAPDPAPDPAAAAPPPAPADAPAPADEEQGSETSRLAAGYPTLTSGSVDPAVVELTTWLQGEGVDVPITNTVTPEVLRALVDYRRANDIEDDVDSVPGGERNRDSWIGPETWAAMVKARD
jgi:hypothetical protein